MSNSSDPTIHFHLDIVDRHIASRALSCLTGWIAAEKGHEIASLGLQVGDGVFVRCHYPFHRGDVQEPVVAEGSGALVGFSVLLPERFSSAGVPACRREDAGGDACATSESERLTFVAIFGEIHPSSYVFPIEPKSGATTVLQLGAKERLSAPPVFTDLSPAEIGPLVENRLFDSFARERHLTLRLDLINKCNLRCVMCHYSNESIAKRPAQRIAPEQFAAFFDPIAPITREVVLSCGDEPLMSPHFETILRDLAARDPEVRIVFCTNAMLLTEKIAAAIVATNVHLVMFSFDGVISETLHRIRVGSDYRRIIKNILGLKRERERAGKSRPRFVFNYVMLESNIHEAPLFVQVARQLGGETIDFRHVVPMDTYDIGHEMLDKRPAKYNFYRDRIVAEAAACGMDIYIPPPLDADGSHDPAGDPAVTLDEFHSVLGGPLAGGGHVSTLDSRQGVKSRDMTPSRERGLTPSRTLETAHCFCDRPFREVMIREQRDVYPCAWHQEKMGTLDGTTTLEEIFFGEKFQKVRLAMLNPLGAPGCRECPIKANRLPTHLLPSGSR